MSTFYKTLNSLYEVDGNRVRRVSGDSDPTPNQGEDGEWQDAAVDTIPSADGYRLFFSYEGDKYTVSSLVQEVWTA